MVPGVGVTRRQQPANQIVGVGADLDTSRIQLGFHYHRDCQVDRQALGTLTGFRSWTAARHPVLDMAAALAILGENDQADFATWRVYLHDRAAGTAQRLEVATRGGGTAFANPTVTMLRDPAGRDALVVTLFLPRHQPSALVRSASWQD
jgi:hypothetical protein